MWSGPLRGGPRLARHLWRMCFALFIAAGSLFSIEARVATILPEPFTTPAMRALPVALVFIAMFYGPWRIRGRRIPTPSNEDRRTRVQGAGESRSSPESILEPARHAQLTEQGHRHRRQKHSHDSGAEETGDGGGASPRRTTRRQHGGRATGTTRKCPPEPPDRWRANSSSSSSSRPPGGRRRVRQTRGRRSTRYCRGR